MCAQRSRPTRRAFLKRTGQTALAISALSKSIPLCSDSTEASEPTQTQNIPPHQPVLLPGLHAYADAESVFAGDSIQLHVSASTRYQCSIWRLGQRLDDADADELLHAFRPSPKLLQPIHPGSYVHVSESLKQPLTAITLECWVRPWSLDSLQGLISQEDKEDARGFALGIGKGGYIGFFLGDGKSPDEAVIHRTTVGAVELHKWNHVLCRWDGAFKEIWINGRRAGRWPFSGKCIPGPHPIRLGAMSQKRMANHFLDGDLAHPALYHSALSDDQIQERFTGKGLSPAPPDSLLGEWRFEEERGERVADSSPAQRHGRIINHATWMIGGPSFLATAVPRYGEYDASRDSTRGHGLRFASDDLYDCRWRPVHRVDIPQSAKPGLYVARFQYDLNGLTHRYDVTFNVRRARHLPRPKILVLCSSNTWRAYNSTPFSETLAKGHSLGTQGSKNSHDDAPAFSCYRNHRAGQPSYHFGLRMPWPSAGPYVLYSSKDTGYSHLMRSERFLHQWLETSGYDFDVIMDTDLHRDPNLPQNYPVFIINGHSEYWSRESRQGLDNFLQKGGSAIVLSGNSLFWRVSFDPETTVMECRKLDERIGGRRDSAVGELFHSDDGQRGSLWRECGAPAWKSIGLECCGWGGTEAKDAGVYYAQQPDHPLFQYPEKIVLSRGQTFGHSPNGKSHRAIGHEYDVRLSTLRRMTHQTPPGVSIPDEPAGIATLAVGKRPDSSALDYFTQPTKAPDGVVSEMIYWERPDGGKVFNAGSIGSGWALAVDPTLQALMRNVLHAFGVSPARSSNRS